MATRIFKGMTTGSTITEASSFPVDVRGLDIRGLAVLSTTGIGILSIEFMDGTTITTPRIPESTPYATLYEKQIAHVKSISGSSVYDIELLTLGVS
ncbi:MAG: hypothetical protein GY928_04835 [Colwellia sp.]|nr:hypothetical protein [Colwellia sp.]